ARARLEVVGPDLHDRSPGGRLRRRRRGFGHRGAPHEDDERGQGERPPDRTLQPSSSNVPLTGNHCLSFEANPTSVLSLKFRATVSVYPEWERYETAYTSSAARSAAYFGASGA